MESGVMAILEHSGIGIRWIQCSPISDNSVSSQCGSPLARAVFQLLITNKPSGFCRNALGSTTQRAAILAVSYENSKHFAAIQDLPAGRVLAHAVAHEIGHLLLGSEHHALNGIMKARFGPEDLYDMGRGWLVFTPEQSRLLREHALSQQIDR